MIDLENLPTLPIGKSLSKEEQYRLLAKAALGILAAVVLLIVVRWILTPAPVTPEQLPPDTFRPTAAQLSTLTITTAGNGSGLDQLTATGAIANDDTRGTPVFMPYGGQVTQVFVDVGVQVNAGQPLLQIKTPDVVDARNALFSAAATERSAEAALKIAEGNAQRQQEIYKTAGGALKDYQQSQSDLIAAQSALRTAQSALGDARDKLAIFGKSQGEINRLERAGGIASIHADTTLRAPISGLIATRAVAPGQFETSGGTTPVFTITDPHHVWMIAQLTESDAANVHVGDSIAVTTPAYPGRIFHTTIDNVAAGLDPTTHRLPVRASIDNPDLALKPQMFASFTIERKATDASALTLPASAIIHEGDTARIWVALPNGLLQARTITVGDSVAGQVKILSGLRAGERVVMAGALFVNEAGTQQ
jgi:cobalt-zinc-cadmium efflux system membrane fusion protein